MLRWYFICVLVLWAAVARAGEIDVNGVPLPDDIKIETLKSVPSSMRRFSGGWIGTWSGGQRTMKHILIVERTYRSGRADAIFAWSDSSDKSVKRGWERLAGKIKGNVLTLVSGRATYRFVNSQRLSARLSPDESIATMRNYPVALIMKDAARPQAALQPAPANPLEITLLGKLDGENLCKLLLSFHNRLDVDLDSGEFEIYLLAKGGLPIANYRLATPRLSSGSRKKVNFELPVDCSKAQAIAGNGFTLCRGTQDYLDQCNAALVLSSSIIMSFSDRAE